MKIIAVSDYLQYCNSYRSESKVRFYFRFDADKNKPISQNLKIASIREMAKSKLWKTSQEKKTEK